MTATKTLNCCECGEPLPTRYGASTLLCARCQREHVPPCDERNLSRERVLRLVAKAREAAGRKR